MARCVYFKFCDSRERFLVAYDVVDNQFLISFGSVFSGPLYVIFLGVDWCHFGFF